MTSKIGWEMSMHEAPTSYPHIPVTPGGPQLPPPYYGAAPAPLYSPQSPLYQQNTCYNNYPQMQLPYPQPVPPSSPPPPYSPPGTIGAPPLQTFQPPGYQQPSSLQYYGDNQQFQNTYQHTSLPYQQDASQPYRLRGDNPPNRRNSDFTPFCPPSAPPSISEAQEHRGSLIRGPSLGFEQIDSNQPNGLYPLLPNESESRTLNPSYEQYKQHPPTPLPPKTILLWEASAPVKIFFIQQEGHVVSPSQSLPFLAYKCPPMHDVSSFPAGSLAGSALHATLLLKVGESWRLGLAKEKSYIVRGLQGEFAFYDNSTSPARYVVVVLPREETKEGRQRLDVLLRGSSSQTDEPANIVDKLESGVESVFDTLTHSVTNVVKKGTPELHKNTKWLRKGTGQVVRFGGSLVSKGVHLVSDNVMDKEVPKTASGQHRELFEALKTYRDAVENKKITNIEQIH